MPRGVPKSGFRKPRTSGGAEEIRPVAPAPGGAVTAPPAMEPVREQVKQMSGYPNLEALKKDVPESTASTPAAETKTRKPRTPVEVDPLMNDPKYKQAIGNMTAFGGKKVVASGFATAASALRDEKFKLSSEEEQVWDEYFYVVSKRSNFDPTSPWFLTIYAVVMLLTQLGSRMWERSGHKGLFDIFKKMEPKEKPRAMPGEDGGFRP